MRRLSPNRESCLPCTLYPYRIYFMSFQSFSTLAFELQLNAKIVMESLIFSSLTVLVGGFLPAMSLPHEYCGCSEGDIGKICAIP